MPAPSSSPNAGPEPPLSVEQLRKLLAACGYRNTVVVGGKYSLPVGCGVALQFGGRVAQQADEPTQATVHCDFAINGSNHHVTGASYWQIEKTVRMFTGAVQTSVAIKANLLLGDGMVVEEAVAYGSSIFRHLRLLLADARDALQTLSIAREDDARVEGPALRIEARFVGSLVAGRSGFVRARAHRGGTGANLSPQIRAFDQRLLDAVCEYLAAQLIPDLARGARSMVARASTNTTLVQSNPRNCLPGSPSCPILTSPI
jgi:hypothetical protein